MRLADLDGVSAGIEFLYLEQGLTAGIQIPGGMSLAMPDDVMIELCEILEAADLQGPLADYLRDAPAPRICQTASRLASLFREYEYHREEWIAAWMTGREAGPPVAMRDAQMVIYRRLCERLAKRGLCTFFTAAREGVLTESDSSLHVFGISQISRLHAGALFRMARKRRVDFYLADFSLACLARPSQSSDEWTELAAPDLPPEADGQIFSWLRPQRELVRLLATCAENARWFIKRPLQATPLTEAFLERAAGRPAQVSGTLEIAAAPGQFREVETAYSDIAARLSEDPSLRPSDIAILVPDISRYRPWVEAVFEREEPSLPYNLTDFTSSGASVYARGVESLLDLFCEAEFRRSQIAALLRNACFQAALGFDDREAAEWIALIDKIGAFRGMSHNDPFTFGSALRRLRLASVFELEPGESYHGVVPAGDPFLSAASAGRFSSVMENLAVCVEETQALAPGDLADGIEKALRRFLRVPQDRREEARVEEGLFAFLDRIRGAGSGFSLPMLAALLRSNTGGLAGSKGEYLAGGVTVAQLQPMRPIPFRLTYVLGLEEGSFPGRADESTMNLRVLAPEPNDVTLPETNRLLFLESLFGARDRIVLSYCCRDVARDADYGPCSVVEELRDFAASCGMSSDVRQVPAHLSIKEALTRTAYLPVPEAVQMHLRENLPVPAFLSGGRPAAVHTMPAEQALPGPVLTLRMLSDYLKRPFDAVLQYIVRLPRTNREDPSLKDIEPFFTSDVVANVLPRKIVYTFLQQESHTEEVLEECARSIYRMYEQRLQVPSGQFGEADCTRITDDIKESFRLWRPTLRGACNQYHGTLVCGERRIHADYPLYQEGAEVIVSEWKASAVKPRDTAGLDAFLFAACLRAAGETRPILCRILHARGLHTFEMPRAGTADFAGYVSRLANDFLAANMVFIPATLVMELLSDREKSSDFVRSVEEALYDESSNHSYSEFFSFLAPYVDDTARDLALDRFSLFLQCRGEL